MGAPGRGASTEELTEGLGFLNQMLDHHSILRDHIYKENDATYVLTAAVQYYLIGPGAVPAVIGGVSYGAIATARPIVIARANIIYQTSPVLRLPVEIINYDPWADIRVPALFAIPLKLYYDGGYSQTAPTGLGVIALWPGPQSTYSLELFSPQALPSTLLISDTLLLPPGYAKCVTYGLADEIQLLYPQKNKGQASRVSQIADECWRALEVINAPRLKATIDPALMGGTREGFNWLYSLG